MIVQPPNSLLGKTTGPEAFAWTREDRMFSYVKTSSRAALHSQAMALPPPCFADDAAFSHFRYSLTVVQSK
ncbi:hypothetical protein AOLI_G00253260 [Acnodon oligacanthus]